jgi:hypothetical protein
MKPVAQGHAADSLQEATMSSKKRSDAEMTRQLERSRERLERETEHLVPPDALDESVRFFVRWVPDDGGAESGPIDVSDLPWSFEWTFVPGPDTIQ